MNNYDTEFLQYIRTNLINLENVLKFITEVNCIIISLISLNLLK